jgi:hypothetical protein
MTTYKLVSRLRQVVRRLKRPPSATVRRFISVFHRGTDDCDHRIDVNDIPLATLQTIFHQESEDAMYFSYDVQANHAEALQPYISEPLDLQRFEYFLEAETA